MENLRPFVAHWYFVPRAILRLLLILLNNAYCIPTYVVWMILLSPLKKINPETFWRIEGYFFHWLLAMVSMWSWSAGYDVVEMGDNIKDCLEERTLVIANHQSTADVPLLMACFNPKKGVTSNLMWIMDSLFKYTNFGIVSVLHQDFFIKSGKDSREQSINELVTHILESYIPRHRKWMMLFPEGGFLRKRRAISQKYAQKHNLPILNNVSLPRVGALHAIMSTVGPGQIANNNAVVEDRQVAVKAKLAFVLDITIAYPKGQPLDLKAIIFGHRPSCKTVLFYRLYSCQDIPHDSEGLSKWLFDRFEEKERMLETFYRTDKIPSEEYSKNPIQPTVVAQDCLRFIILHVFFFTSTYIHVLMILAVYDYYKYLIN